MIRLLTDTEEKIQIETSFTSYEEIIDKIIKEKGYTKESLDKIEEKFEEHTRHLQLNYSLQTYSFGRKFRETFVESLVNYIYQKFMEINLTKQPGMIRREIPLFLSNDSHSNYEVKRKYEKQLLDIIEKDYLTNTVEDEMCRLMNRCEIYNELPLLSPYLYVGKKKLPAEEALKRLDEVAGSNYFTEHYSSVFSYEVTEDDMNNLVKTIDLEIDDPELKKKEDNINLIFDNTEIILNKKLMDGEWLQQFNLKEIRVLFALFYPL